MCKQGRNGTPIDPDLGSSTSNLRASRCVLCRLFTLWCLVVAARVDWYRLQGAHCQPLTMLVELKRNGRFCKRRENSPTPHAHLTVRALKQLHYLWRTEAKPGSGGKQAALEPEPAGWLQVNEQTSPSKCVAAIPACWESDVICGAHTGQCQEEALDQCRQQ